MQIKIFSGGNEDCVEDNTNAFLKNLDIKDDIHSVRLTTSARSLALGGTQYSIMVCYTKYINPQT